MLFPQFKTNPLTGCRGLQGREPVSRHSPSQIQLPKLGKVQINLHRPIPDGFVIKQLRVVKKAVGWFAVVAIESELVIRHPVPHGRAIGVDVGLLSYVATSDGYTEKRPKFFKTAYRRLKVLQKRLSRKMKRGKNYQKARIKVAKQHNHIAFKRTDYQFKLAHKLCDMADTIYVEECDFRMMAKGMLGKHMIDAAFGKQRDILEYVARKRDVFVGRVDHRGTSQTCPNCRAEVRKDLSDRYHVCHECGYVVDRDIASSQEICNRGEETYRGTREKQEIGSQVVLSGNFVVDKWRNSANAVRGANSISDNGSQHRNL